MGLFLRIHEGVQNCSVEALVPASSRTVPLCVFMEMMYHSTDTEAEQQLSCGDAVRWDETEKRERNERS